MKSTCNNIRNFIQISNTTGRLKILALASLCFSSLVLANPDARQTTLLVNNCLQCHANPETTAPVIGVAEDWKEINAQGEEEILKNVVQGIRGMPPLGYCSACSEEDLRVLLRVMTGLPENKGI